MTPDRTLSGSLEGIAAKLAGYMDTGVTLEAVAVRSTVLLLLRCQALAAALEEAAADRDRHLAMAADLTSVSQDPADRAVDLSGMLKGGPRSAVVLSFPQRGA